MMKREILIIAAVMTGVAALGADSTAVAHRIGFDINGSYVMPTNSIVRGNNRFDAVTRSAFGFAAEYSFSFAPDSRYGRYYPYAYQGAGVGMNIFSSSKVTGNPLGFVWNGTQYLYLTKLFL